MILHHINLNAVNDYIHLERYVNIGSPSGFTEINNTSRNTHPKYGQDTFHLCSITFSRDIPFKDYGVKPPFFSWEMLIHPDMVNESILAAHNKTDLKALEVAPTSSSRTVKMINNPGWFLKLNYKGVIGRMERNIGHKQASSAIEVSDIITGAIDQCKLPEKFFFMRERFARVFELTENNSAYEWGIVLREEHVYPISEKVKYHIPAFSLFSKDDKNPADPTILTQLIQAQNKPAKNYLFDDIITPVFECYFELLLTCGLGLECHAQNTLFAIDENYKVVGIIIKDAESIDKDLGLMNKLNITHSIQSTDWKCLRESDYNYQIMHSFMFDFKLGEYLIMPIIKNALESFDFSLQELILEIKRYNQRYISLLPADYFPEDGKWYNYDNIMHDRSKKRPYKSNDNPKFR